MSIEEKKRIIWKDFEDNFDKSTSFKDYLDEIDPSGFLSKLYKGSFGNDSINKDKILLINLTYKMKFDGNKREI